jgi:hypothetical protein
MVVQQFPPVRNARQLRANAHLDNPIYSASHDLEAPSFNH